VTFIEAPTATSTDILRSKNMISVPQRAHYFELGLDIYVPVLVVIVIRF